MTEKKWPMMATIQGTYERAQAENIGISRNAIRELVLSGAIPSVRIGEKQSMRLVNYQVFLDFIFGNSVNTTKQPQPGQIRKINV